MTKTALLKLLLAIVITFILVLPEYFKTPKGNMLELSCLEVCLQPNLTYSPSFLNFSFVTFLQPVRETQTMMGIFLNHSNCQNFTRRCQDITSEFKMCTSCLICESKENMDFISQEQTSKVLIMKASMEVKANDFHSLCQHFNLTVAPTADHLEEYNVTCNPNTNTRSSSIMAEDPTKEEAISHTCGIMNYPNNCIHISLHLETDAKDFSCSMKIIWYVLVILVFIFFLILIIHKILHVHRRVPKWQNEETPEPFFERLSALSNVIQLKKMARAEAALNSLQGRAFPNTRTRSSSHDASARAVYMNILLKSLGQFGPNPFEEYS